jgi:hypothetical protein
MVSIPTVGVEVTAGNFLLGSIDDYQGQLIVCQVVEVVPASEVLVVRWLEDAQLKTYYQNDTRPPLRSQYEDVMRCKLKEVTKYGSLEKLHTSSIHGVAFVFHVLDLEYTWVNCSGMQSVFFTRYELLQSGEFMAIEHSLNLPFSSSHPESYTSRLWYSLMFLKDKPDSLMNKKTQHQVCRASGNIFLSMEVWDFFVSSLMALYHLSFFSKNRSKPCMFCDLSLATRSSNAFFAMLRMSNQPSMDMAQGKFLVQLLE